jgi:hypothetical protein
MVRHIFLSTNRSAFSRRSAKHDQLPLSRLVLRHFRQILVKFGKKSFVRAFVGLGHSSGVDMSADEEVFCLFFIQSGITSARASSNTILCSRVLSHC